MSMIKKNNLNLNIDLRYKLEIGVRDDEKRGFYFIFI